MKMGNGSPAYQRGVSKLGLLLLALFIAAFLMIGLKVGPFYIENNVLTDYAQELVSSGSANDMSQDEIRQRLAETMRLNNIRGIDLSVFQIRRSGGNTSISIAYERRVTLVANMDMIAKFNYTTQ